jgi:hypothetical protein
MPTLAPNLAMRLGSAAPMPPLVPPHVFGAICGLIAMPLGATYLKSLKLPHPAIAL